MRKASKKIKSNSRKTVLRLPDLDRFAASETQSSPEVGQVCELCERLALRFEGLT